MMVISRTYSLLHYSFANPHSFSKIGKLEVITTFITTLTWYYGVLITSTVRDAIILSALDSLPLRIRATTQTSYLSRPF